MVLKGEDVTKAISSQTSRASPASDADSLLIILHWSNLPLNPLGTVATPPLGTGAIALWRIGEAESLQRRQEQLWI